MPQTTSVSSAIKTAISAFKNNANWSFVFIAIFYIFLFFIAINTIAYILNILGINNIDLSQPRSQIQLEAQLRAGVYLILVTALVIVKSIQLSLKAMDGNRLKFLDMFTIRGLGGSYLLTLILLAVSALPVLASLWLLDAELTSTEYGLAGLGVMVAYVTIGFIVSGLVIVFLGWRFIPVLYFMFDKHVSVFRAIKNTKKFLSTKKLFLLFTTPFIILFVFIFTTNILSPYMMLGLGGSIMFLLPLLIVIFSVPFLALVFAALYRQIEPKEDYVAQEYTINNTQNYSKPDQE